jgi:hypothetical protein
MVRGPQLMDRRGRASSMARGEVGAGTRACLLFLKDTSHCIAGCGPCDQLEKMDMRCESHSAKGDGRWGWVCVAKTASTQRVRVCSLVSGRSRSLEGAGGGGGYGGGHEHEHHPSHLSKG